MHRTPYAAWGSSLRLWTRNCANSNLVAEPGDVLTLFLLSQAASALLAAGPTYLSARGRSIWPQLGQIFPGQARSPAL